MSSYSGSTIKQGIMICLSLAAEFVIPGVSGETLGVAGPFAAEQVELVDCRSPVRGCTKQEPEESSVLRQLGVIDEHQLSDGPRIGAVCRAVAKERFAAICWEVQVKVRRLVCHVVTRWPIDLTWWTEVIQLTYDAASSSTGPGVFRLCPYRTKRDFLWLSMHREMLEFDPRGPQLESELTQLVTGGYCPQCDCQSCVVNAPAKMRPSGKYTPGMNKNQKRKVREKMTKEKWARIRAGVQGADQPLPPPYELGPPPDYDEVLQQQREECKRRNASKKRKCTLVSDWIL